MRHRLLAVVAGLALSCTWVSIADAGGRVGNRLYRHSNGGLYGQSRPLALTSGGVVFWGQAASGPEGYGWAPDDDRLIRDQRRDRALAAARAVNVDLGGGHGGAPTFLPTRHRSIDTGWDLIAQGEPVRALARFSVARMTAPGSAEAVLGYAIAAAAIGDRRAASVSLGEAVALDRDVLSRIPRNETMDATLTSIVQEFETGDVYAARVANALRTVVDGDDETPTPPVLLARQDETSSGPALLILRP